MKTFFCWLLLTIPVYAADVVRCNPADPLVPNRVISYERSVSIELSELTSSILRNPDLSSVSGLAPRYWKCAAGAVVAMSSAEQTTLDAPDIAEQARRNGLTTEITTNDLCTAELSDLESRIETRRTTLQSAIETQRVTNNTTITNAANNVAGVKSAMTTINNVTATEFNQSVDELASLAKKIAKCVKSRTDRGVGQ